MTTRAEMAKEDRQLKPLILSSRTTYDRPGVLVGIIVDEGQRPYGPERLVGRLTIEQAEGFARSLQLMAKIAREEVAQFDWMKLDE